MQIEADKKTFGWTASLPGGVCIEQTSSPRDPFFVCIIEW
jgi:hypothetical protein